MNKQTHQFCHSKFQQNLGFQCYNDDDHWELKNVNIHLTEIF